MRILRTALLLLALLCGCRPLANTLTIAIALLPSELPAYRNMLGEFERATGQRIVLVPQQYADIRRALAAEAFAHRGTLDLVELDVYTLAAAAPDIMVLDDEQLSREAEALQPQALEVGRIDGWRFLPHRLQWPALIYNHSTLGKPPADWQELLAVARTYPGQIGIKGALYEGLTCEILPFVWAAGGSGEVLDDAGALAAFHLFAELAPYLNRHSATFKEPTVAEAMARGEIVLQFNWPAIMSLYADQGLAPQIIRSAPLPRGPRGGATVLGGGYIGIPRSAPHRSDALRLARYLISQPVQERLRRELGWFSARNDITIGETDTLLAGFIASRDEVRPRPQRTDYQRLSRLWQQAFRAVVFEHADPAATLHAAQRELTSGN